VRATGAVAAVTGARSAVVAALASVAVSLAACASTSAEEADGAEGPVVVATMSVIADFAQQVADDRVEVRTLVPVGGDPHTHEPTPADARAVADADLLLANGAGLEPWFETLVTDDVAVVRLTDALHDEVVATADGEPDPHLWMVPGLAATYVEVLAEALADADPDHADAYRADARAYVEDLRALHEEITEALDAIPPERRVLVTPHDAYAYFADAYDLEVASVVGVSTEEEPSAAAVQRLIDEVRERQIPTVFVEATVSRTVIERIATDAGVEVGRPLYGDSVGEPGSGAETYVDMLRANVEALVEGLAR
jgi:ABC-type Zn uptake system ZnuABC Zn-binding protein ZnuA